MFLTTSTVRSVCIQKKHTPLICSTVILLVRFRVDCKKRKKVIYIFKGKDTFLTESAWNSRYVALTLPITHSHSDILRSEVKGPL